MAGYSIDLLTKRPIAAAKVNIILVTGKRKLKFQAIITYKKYLFLILCFGFTIVQDIKIKNRDKKDFFKSDEFIVWKSYQL